MTDALLNAIKWLLVCTAALGAAFYGGAQHERAAQAGAEGTAIRQAQKQYQEEVARGQQAAVHYLIDLSERDTRYAELETKFASLRARVPLLVPGSASVATDALGAQVPGTGLKPDLAAPASAAQCVHVALRPELSLGAVWVWNSALAGADVPAGACGADAATAEACAAGTGLTAEDAWDNHTRNARTCAEDRFRLQRLIDYLEGKQQ